MTLDAARAFVANVKTAHTIYRLPAWPENVWSVTKKTKKELPDGAVVDTPPASEPEPLQIGGLFS